MTLRPEIVMSWYDAHARDLPWRRTRDPWPVLVSEVMLQQTPVARVLPVYREWVTRWPEPAALAAVPAGEAIRAWGRLGYPRRALRLHSAATVITDVHGGRVPAELELLLALPGVGDYTARAVASFAFGQRHAVLDTNVRRVLARAVGGVAEPAPPRTGDLAAAERLLPAHPAAAAAFGVAVMELGALVCTARAPRCGSCPLVSDCAWAQAGRPPSGRAHRRQVWSGSDRQARGAVLALLRDTERAVPHAALAAGWPDRSQLTRALAGLVEDGLVQRVGDGAAYRLPG